MERSRRNLARHGGRIGLSPRRNGLEQRVHRKQGESAGEGEDFRSENSGWAGEMKREKREERENEGEIGRKTCPRSGGKIAAKVVK